MITNYKSIKTIIAKLYRDIGPTTASSISEGHMVEWIAEALSKIGSYYQYEQLKTCIEVDSSGKAKLPVNFYRLVDIAYQSQPLSWASNNLINDYGCDGCTIPTCCTGHNFYINDCYVVTDIKPTDADVNDPKLVCISYLGVPVDEEGFPKVPDDVYFDEALSKYITYMVDYREWRKANIPDKVFQKSEQDWLFYVNSARGAANMPGLGQLENLKNMWVRMIPKSNEYNNFFANNSKQERRYNH